MKCDGRKCQLKEIYRTSEQQEEFVQSCVATIEQCQYFTPKEEERTLDYYEGFHDACHFILAALKEARESERLAKN